MWWWLVSVAMAGDVSGRFEIAEPEAVIQARIDAVVDEAASQFGIFKGLAKSRIARGAVWCKTFTFTPKEDELGWQCDDKPRFGVPHDKLGEQQRLDLPKGEVIAVVQRQGRDIHATFGSEEGGRRQAFRFQDEDVMVFDVSIESPRLDKPMQWTIRYQRVGDAPTEPPASSITLGASPQEEAANSEAPSAPAE